MTMVLRHADTLGSAHDSNGHVHRGGLVLWALIVASVAPTTGHTAPVSGDETRQIHLRYNHRDLTSPDGARKLLQRINAAALEVCGASSMSLAELKRATRESSCWRNAVAGAVRRIDSAALTTVATNSPLPLAQ